MYAASVIYGKSPIGKHIMLQHKYKIPDVSFFALDRIHTPSRGGVFGSVDP